MSSIPKNSRKSRRIARELALLNVSQLSESSTANISSQPAKGLSEMVSDAVAALTNEIKDTLEVASSELNKGNDRLLNSELKAIDVNSARTMVEDAIKNTQTAINHLATAVELPEFVQLSNQSEVRHYATELIRTVQSKRAEIDELLTEVLFNWQLSRVTRIDRDILRMAVAEIQYIGQSPQIVINEAVELAKRYSDDEGRRFINGVLRRVSDRLKGDVEISETLASN